MTCPKISVITPSYNSSKYLEAAIESVLAQHYDNFEHIVVDGGSKDGTLDILKRYPHLKWVSEPDRGQAHAMNKGFLMSSGDVIVYLNADDYFLPEAFSAVIEYFKCGSEVVVGKIKILHDNGEFKVNDPGCTLEDMLKWWKPDYFCYNPVGYFYLRKVQERILFNESNHFSMDYEFMLEVGAQYKITKSEDTLGVFRHIEGTKTCSRQKSFTKLFKEKIKLTEKYIAVCGDDYRKNYYRERRKFIFETHKRNIRVSFADTLMKLPLIYPLCRCLYRKFLKAHI